MFLCVCVCACVYIYIYTYLGVHEVLLCVLVTAIDERVSRKPPYLLDQRCVHLLTCLSAASNCSPPMFRGGIEDSISVCMC